MRHVLLFYARSGRGLILPLSSSSSKGLILPFFYKSGMGLILAFYDWSSMALILLFSCHFPVSWQVQYGFVSLFSYWSGMRLILVFSEWSRMGLFFFQQVQHELVLLFLQLVWAGLFFFFFWQVKYTHVWSGFAIFRHVHGGLFLSFSTGLVLAGLPFSNRSNVGLIFALLAGLSCDRFRVGLILLFFYMSGMGWFCCFPTGLRCGSVSLFLQVWYGLVSLLPQVWHGVGFASFWQVQCGSTGCLLPTGLVWGSFRCFLTGQVWAGFTFFRQVQGGTGCFPTHLGQDLFSSFLTGPVRTGFANFWPVLGCACFAVFQQVWNGLALPFSNIPRLSWFCHCSTGPIWSVLCCFPTRPWWGLFCYVSMGLLWAIFAISW